MWSMSELKAHKIKFFAFGFMNGIFFVANNYYEENHIARKD